MKYIFSVSLILLHIFTYSQIKKSSIDFAGWKKAVVNIETESPVFNSHTRDSILKSKKDSGYSYIKLDSLNKTFLISRISTGTAIYITYKSRKYLLTAKHVLNDEILADQKKYETKNNIAHWDNNDCIFPRVSIRTPFKYFTQLSRVNNSFVLWNNFIKTPSPFFFISDSTGDGIGVISLQQKSFKFIDTVLQFNGYTPISLTDVITKDSINELDEIYTVGFPENVSIVGRVKFNEAANQLPDLVTPFVVKGNVAMCEINIQHFYVDMTVTPGNSGGPVIKNNKLIGIVSGINKYKIINEGNLSEATSQLYGIGHLVIIIKVNELLGRMEEFQKEEDALTK